MANMTRPSLNPMFMEDAKPAPVKVPRWKKVLRVFGRALKLLFTDVFAKFRGQKQEELRDEATNPVTRFIRGLMYRLMIVPVLVVVLITFLVLAGTHPKLTPAVTDPASQGVHYDPVDLVSGDNTKLEGWLVPVLDARRVIREKENMLHKRYPAMVLVHDYGMSRQQVLPLVNPLHDAGYVTLSINLRGHGPSSGTGSTFGINEAQDVKAAVELLRRRRYVDPDAIGVIGIGTGATAALLAAKEDPRLRVLVLDHPTRDFEELLETKLAPRQEWLQFVKPLCKYAFELAYKVDAEEVNLNRFLDVLKTRHAFVLDDETETVSCTKPVRTRQVVDFLKKHLVVRKAMTKGSIIQKDRVGSLPGRPQAIPMDAEDGGILPQRRAADILDKAW
jgi:pimeloyl-ACP methyl ester carboxylesterase